MKPYQMSADQVISALHTDIQNGLSAQEVSRRIKKYGLNALPEQRKETMFHVFLRQFMNPLIYLLLVAAAIIFFVGQRLDAFIISGVLLFNAVVGTIQEGRTRSIIESLRRFLKSDSVVIRDGEHIVIPDKNLVVGDIIILKEGARVPADARLVQANSLLVDEAMLTGESIGVVKDVDALENKVPIYEQKNMVFKGTYVLSGEGLAVVVATGAQTEVGQLNKTVEQVSGQMPLKDELERLSHWIIILVLGICLFLFVIGLMSGKPLADLLVTLTALFICVIPEGLPVVLTLVLVSGAYRMAKHRVLVKRFHAVEAFGRIDTVVMDKTGTLTRNEMMVTHAYIDGKTIDVSGKGYFPEGDLVVDGKKVDRDAIATDSNLYRMGIACTLLGHAEISLVKKQQVFTIKGEPTEAAIQVFAKKMGLDPDVVEQHYECIHDIPFDSTRGYHAEFSRAQDEDYLFVSGSPERIMELSGHIDGDIHKALRSFLDEGLRVIAIAYKKMPQGSLIDGENNFESLVSNLNFLGLLGIQDVIRQGVGAIVQEARQAGIRVIMATGDHQKTALFVAKKVGLFLPGDESIEGPEFERQSTAQQLDGINKTTVYARVLPALKLRLIDLLHKKNHVVAMTGDGVNDVPSIVAADVGIAMGGIGTEVAKQAADVILLDDSFNSIMQGVLEGRHTFYTLKRVVLYFFATNMGEVLVVLFALALQLPLPILAAQILWLNLITDGFLDMALATEPKEKDLLLHEPPGKRIRLFDKHLLFKMMYMAIPMGIGSLGLFYYYYRIDLALARTITLVTMAMFQWFNAWNCRSQDRSVFQLGLTSNRWLLVAFAVVFFLQLFIIYVPPMQQVFSTVPLSLFHWIIIFVVSSSIFVIEELRKYYVQHFLN